MAEKVVVTLNEHAKLQIEITEQMRKDFAECERMAYNGGKSCDTCSLCCMDCLGIGICEIPALRPFLSLREPSAGSSEHATWKQRMLNTFLNRG